MTSSVDFVPAALRVLVLYVLTHLDALGQLPLPTSQMSREQILSVLPPWLVAVIFVEDMKGAYRQCPVLPEHHCVSVIAFWHEEWQCIAYIILLGLPFGLSSAVINFNRVPTFGSAVLRRIAAVPASPFFDDTGAVDLFVASHSGQRGMQRIYALFGWKLDPLKSQPAGFLRIYLGTAVDLGAFLLDGHVKVDLKPGSLLGLVCFHLH